MGLSKWEEDLLKNADAVIDKSPMEPLYAGVFFNQNRKVDLTFHLNLFLFS